MSVPPAGGSPAARPRRPFPFALAIGIPFALFVLCCGGCGILAFVAAPREAPVLAEDREVLVTAAHLAEWSEIDADPAAGKITKRRQLGSWELEYEYEPPSDDLFVYGMVSYEPSARQARDTYRTSGLGVQIGFAMEGDDVQRIERNDLFRWGDESRMVLLENANGPVGNLFLARKDRRVIMVMFVGVYFDDPDTLAAMLEPRLDALDAWQPRAE